MYIHNETAIVQVPSSLQKQFLLEVKEQIAAHNAWDLHDGCITGPTSDIYHLSPPQELPNPEINQLLPICSLLFYWFLPSLTLPEGVSVVLHFLVVKYIYGGFSRITGVVFAC